MPSVTITGASDVNLTFSTNDSAPFAFNLGGLIGAGLTSGALTAFNYVSGATAPGPATGTGGVAVFGSGITPTTTVDVPVTDSAIVDSSTGPLSITGGAAGETVVAGSGALNYTDITPSGDATDYIVAGDGNNLISTSTVGGGNYSINLGSGNDSVSINGNSSINAGTGHNFITVGGGGSIISSEGFDSITGSSVASATADTVNIGSGQTTVDPGASNFFIFGTSTTTNPLVFKPGTGSDTISVGSGGGNVFAGSGGNSILFGGAGGGSAPVVLHGTADGDQIFSIGAGNVTAIAGAGNETITGAGGSPDGFSVPGSTGNNTFEAGSGNDTLIAGAGQDTLWGGTGNALLQSGTGADTFEFQFGSGGQDTVTGFKATDTLQFNGFGLTSTTLPETSVGGSTVIALNDGTTVTLQGVTSLNPAQVKAT
jgi:Ca2+-binding RTX toxin-like protein